MDLFTIGFTKKPARKFFDLLRDAGTKRLIDVRLNNVSQLAGFAKRDDLAFFVEAICDMEYVHLPELAPTQQMLDAYKKTGGSWATYESQFVDLMRERRIEEAIPRELLENSCLLCSEDAHHHCHRRLVAEYLNEHWGGICVQHLA
jgi:uncharacterized protein (DUF488 family)